MADDSHIMRNPIAGLADRLASAKRAIPQARMIDYGLSAHDAAQLHALDGDGQAEWWAVAEALAQRHLDEAQRHADAGRQAICRLERERAAAAFNIGQLAIHRDDETKRRLYSRASSCLEVNTNQGGCDYRRLKLPVDAGRYLYGWDFPVPDSIGHVVMFGGLSGWGVSFLRLARSLNRQGIGVVLAEAPGQGDTRLLSSLHLSRTSLLQATRFIDFVAEAGKPVGLVGFSFGGLIAAHLAAAAPAVAALCTNGSPVAVGSLDHAAEREQFAAAFGVEDAELLRQVRDFAFDASTEVLRCPLLSLEGGADPLVPSGTWRGFAGDRREEATPLFWEDGLHTLYNHAVERDAVIAAWVSDCFREGLDN